MIHAQPGIRVPHATSAVLHHQLLNPKEVVASSEGHGAAAVAEVECRDHSDYDDTRCLPEMWAIGVLALTQQDLGALNQTFGMETTAPALSLRKYWQMRFGCHYYYCYWWRYYFCCWRHDCCCQPYGSKLEAFRGQCWAVYRRVQSPCRACASTLRNLLTTDANKIGVKSDQRNRKYELTQPACITKCPCPIWPAPPFGRFPNVT